MPELSSSASFTHDYNKNYKKQNINNSNNVIINMRVTANSVQGHRKYMEDCYKIRFQRESSLNNNANKTINDPQHHQNFAQQSDILFSYFGIFDGHGGKEASQYCKEKLYWKIIELDDFWSDDDSKVLNAIRNGFVRCHLDMWRELPNWPKTPSGLPSTSGSTATVLFIKKNKAYVGHVGDSGLVIGYSKYPGDSWHGKKLTRDHKPEDPIELKRIQSIGGSVMSKSGVNRVVWNRPIFNSSSSSNFSSENSSSHSSLSTCSSTPYELNYLRNQKNVPTERVPFLAVARSLGDLWSYETQHDEFLVSPVPDTFVFEIDPRYHKCLILATDGLWNVLKSSESVELVRQTDRETERLVSKKSNSTNGNNVQPFINPSQRLVNTALQKCCEKMIRADNTSCITIMIDQPPEFSINNQMRSSRTFNDFSCANNTTNLEEDEDIMSDFEDEDQDDSDDTINTTRRTRRSMRSVISNYNNDEFTTPTMLNNDKRSRSLISVRRRHWSASSNRSTNTASSQQQANCKKYANVEPVRSQNYYNDNNNLLNKSASANSIICTSRNKRNNQVFQNINNKDKLNLTTTSAINKISKNLRKSLNDLYNKKTVEDQKENKKRESPISINNTNKYTKRLKRLKNRLIQTKNNLFNRKSNNILKSPLSNKDKLKSISSPHLTKLNISSINLNGDNKRNNQDIEDDYNDIDLSIKPVSNNNDSNNRSFVNNVKSRFGYLKRNRSKNKLPNVNSNNSDQSVNFLNSTTNIQTQQQPLHASTKRPKFY